MTLLRNNPRRDPNEKLIIEYLRRAGCLVSRLSAPGIPDLLVGYRGVYLLMEVKQPGGRLKDRQVMYHDAALALGLPCYVIFSVEDCQRILRKWARSDRG